MKCDICGKRHYLGRPPMADCLRAVKSQAWHAELKIRQHEKSPAAYTAALLDLHARRMR